MDERSGGIDSNGGDGGAAQWKWNDNFRKVAYGTGVFALVILIELQQQRRQHEKKNKIKSKRCREADVYSGNKPQAILILNLYRLAGAKAEAEAISFVVRL